MEKFEQIDLYRSVSQHVHEDGIERTNNKPNELVWIMTYYHADGFTEKTYYWYNSNNKTYYRIDECYNSDGMIVDGRSIIIIP